jgi:iron complex outermembrane receptor protein
MKKQFADKILAVAVVTGVQATGMPAFSQDGEPLMLEEVIVTAQKRAESVQDVPFTVNAMQGDALQEMQLTSFEDLQLITPGLDMRNIDARAGSIAIRGVDYNPNSAAAQAVDVYWNGMTLGSNASGGIFQEMYDLGRVEILRGPQGTLQGRTSPAGAISIYTAKPTMDEMEAYARTTFTDNKGNNTQAAASIPLIDGKLATRLAGVFKTSEKDQIDNVLGGDTSESETTSGRLSMLWYATDTISLDLVYQYMENDVDTYSVLSGSSALGQDLPDLRARDRLGITPQVDQYDGRFENMALTLNWELENHDLTYVGGYSEVSSFRSFDNSPGNSKVGYDPVAATAEYPQMGVRDSQLNSPQTMEDQNYASSHELRLSSTDNTFFNYILGLYYGSESGHFDRGLMREVPLGASSVFFGNTVETPFSNQDYGVFGHGRFDFNNNWNLQLGLRWQENKRDVESTVLATEDAVTPFGTLVQEGDELRVLIDPEFQSQSWDAVTGTSTLQYAFNSMDALTYLTAGTSYRPGGVTVAAQDLGELTQFDEEDSWFLEAGWKSNLMDNRLRLNAALFYQDYENYIGRVTRIAINPAGIPNPDGSPSAAASITTNGDATVQGIEMDFEYLITANWRFAGGISYVEAQYKDGVTLPCNDGENIPAGSVANYCDVSGDELGPQPRLSASMRSDYTLAFDRFEAYAAGLYKFTGRRTDTDVSSGELGGFATFDLHLGARDPGATWDVSIFARNLFDREATVSAQAGFRDFNGNLTGYQKMNIIRQRLIGISGTYRF